jgi:hypothetical protein
MVSNINGQDVFDEHGKLMDGRYDKRAIRFLEEFEWYIEAFKNQRAKVLHIRQLKELVILHESLNYAIFLLYILYDITWKHFRTDINR